MSLQTGCARRISGIVRPDLDSFRLRTIGGERMGLATAVKLLAKPGSGQRAQKALADLLERSSLNAGRISVQKLQLYSESFRALVGSRTSDDSPLPAIIGRLGNPKEVIWRTKDINIYVLLPHQIRLLSPEQIGLLSSDQIQAFSPYYISGLLSEQIPGFLPDQLKHLPLDFIQAFSPSHIMSLTPEQIQALLPFQINALSYEQIRAFSPAQIKEFLPDQVRALSLEQRQALLSYQIDAIRLGKTI